MDPSAPAGTQGKEMMERKLRLYLWWKGKLSARKEDGRRPFALPDKSGEALHRGDKTAAAGVSEALKKKDQVTKERGANRRRVRGGVPAGGGATVKRERGGYEDRGRRDDA